MVEVEVETDQLAGRGVIAEDLRVGQDVESVAFGAPSIELTLRMIPGGAGGSVVACPGGQRFQEVRLRGEDRPIPRPGQGPGFALSEA